MKEEKRKMNIPERVTGQDSAPRPMKVLEEVVKELDIVSEIAARLNIQSTEILRKFTGSVPIKEDKEDKIAERQPPSTILVHRLQEIQRDLNKNILEISSNLEELERIW